jgi:hypothetical protein
MTALAAPRPTLSLETGANYWRTFPVLAEAIIYPGAAVAITAAGYLVPASTSATLRSVGIAAPKRDQMDRDGVVDATGLASGDKSCEVQSCIALMVNGSTSITLADVGNDCYLSDDQTVVKTDGSVAGTAQVTRGDVAFNGTDLVGLAVDSLPELTVASDTSDDITVAKLRDAWNKSAEHFAAALATIDTSGAESWIILSFKDGGAATHTVAAVSPATADVVTITNTTARVAPIAATRSVAGKVWQVDARGVWVALGLPS